MSAKHEQSIAFKYSGLYWMFTSLFLIIGILNFVYVHSVPGLFYTILALAYAPFFQKMIIRKIGFRISRWILIVLGLIILWATLAVGDLFELFEAWMLH
ncbi:MAG: hypothetical protein HKP45_05250 [Winogradskyella sp.]|nr:hypothetical protein [Winogradskyella sp.]MBT8377506.1 hypothetical protein [Bacteroidia bacterium]NNF86293.1 hypothetical protein [Winogradskyella sp.]NNK40044.1 hypothetical protein [Winogradskyella sp.]